MLKSYNTSIIARRIARNEKFITENIIMYCLVFSGLWSVYSLNVIRLARDAIRLPTPPIFTPINVV